MLESNQPNELAGKAEDERTAAGAREDDEARRPSGLWGRPAFRTPDNDKSH
jgi:hypothetical protein